MWRLNVGVTRSRAINLDRQEHYLFFIDWDLWSCVFELSDKRLIKNVLCCYERGSNPTLWLMDEVNNQHDTTRGWQQHYLTLQLQWEKDTWELCDVVSSFYGFTYLTTPSSVSCYILPKAFLNLKIHLPWGRQFEFRWLWLPILSNKCNCHE